MYKEWSKEVFAKNLVHYMNERGKTQKELADIAGVSEPTFSYWVNAVKFPRIDKIQRLADYFGIMKSDLIEEKLTPEEQGAFEAKLLKDKEMMDMMKLYATLDEKNKRAIRQMVETLASVE